MNREKLLSRLLEKKMASSTKSKAFCVCLARKSPGEQRATAFRLKK